MLMLSSTAYSVFWLARYLVRIERLCEVLPFKDDQMAYDYATAFGLKVQTADGLNQLYADDAHGLSMSALFQAVRDNVQQLRAVFQLESYVTLNALTKPTNELGTISYCERVQRCHVVFAEEIEPIKYFYQLGLIVERMDGAIRLNEPTDHLCAELDQLLPYFVQLDWLSLKDVGDALIQQATSANLSAFSMQLNALFENGP